MLSGEHLVGFVCEESWGRLRYITLQIRAHFIRCRDVEGAPLSQVVSAAAAAWAGIIATPACSSGSLVSDRVGSHMRMVQVIFAVGVAILLLLQLYVDK